MYVFNENYFSNIDSTEIIFRIENNVTHRKENKDAVKKWLSMEKVSEWHE